MTVVGRVPTPDMLVDDTTAIYELKCTTCGAILELNRLEQELILLGHDLDKHTNFFRDHNHKEQE